MKNIKSLSADARCLTSISAMRRLWDFGADDGRKNVMKIGLIDVDGHNYPNLPLMKLSAYHKAQGDSVEWYQPMFSGHMDRVYLSKVFSFTPDYEYYIDADEIHRGGGQDTASN